MTESTTGNGKSVKELVNDLSGHVDAYALTQATQTASLQTQITDVRIGLETHKAGEGHEGMRKTLEGLRTDVRDLGTAQAEARGERSGSERAWKFVYAIMTLPGIGAVIALLLNLPK